MTDNDVILDLQRSSRIGMSEAIFCAGKTADQINRAIDQSIAADKSILLTHLDADKAKAIKAEPFDYDETSETAIAGPWTPPEGKPRVAIVSAGTSDLPIVNEAARTLAFHGTTSKTFIDVGVSGLWRLLRLH